MTPDTEAQIKDEIAKLKELLCFKIEALEKLTEERFESSRIALKIQAAEYERRLNMLNGEQERNRQVIESCIPRELYASEHQALVQKVDSLLESRSNTEGRTKGISATWALLGSVIFIILAVISIVISLVK